MLCLVLWGGHLEKRIGSLYFLIVYFSAMILGAIIGDLTFAGPYLTVGASGATSGILGALLCLWILGKAGLDANFFAINIGLNVAFAITNPKVNWRIHLGGFVIGLVACAVLDLIEKINARLLRCKFPEFVKINLAILACAAAILLFGNRLPAAAYPATPTTAIAYVVACCLVIKLADIVLSTKKGLAAIVVALALANGASILLGGMALIQRNESADTGDIVVALIDEEEATLKRFRRRGASIALEPANAAYEVRILPPNRVRIQGKLIGLYRKY